MHGCMRVHTDSICACVGVHIQACIRVYVSMCVRGRRTCPARRHSACLHIRTPAPCISTHMQASVHICMYNYPYACASAATHTDISLVAFPSRGFLPPDSRRCEPIWPWSRASRGRADPMPPASSDGADHVRPRSELSTRAKTLGGACPSPASRRITATIVSPTRARSCSFGPL